MSNLSDLLPAGASAKQITATDSGSGIASKAPVVMSASGTVAAVGIQPESLGSAVVFETGLTTATGSAYDATNKKVVISYRDEGNSNYGTAVVGTVSGTSISFGTPVVFEAASVDHTEATFDSGTGKIVLAYQKVSANGSAIVGTVSGTSISFGTAVQFDSDDSEVYGIAYDSSASKVVISYVDTGNTNRGTAVVGTVSGTSISFGTPVVFDNGNLVDADSGGIVYDITNSKVVLAYRDASNQSHWGAVRVGTVSGTSISFGTKNYFSDYTVYSGDDSIAMTYDSTNSKVIIIGGDGNQSNKGSAHVGTVSGTTISFGTKVAGFTAGVFQQGAATFDSTNGKVLVIYQDNNNSSYGTYYVGTVSGTSISFGSPAVYESAITTNNTAVFDSDQGVSVFGYRDQGNSPGQGTAICQKNTGTNLTAQAFVGVADSAISASAAGSIIVQGGTVTGLSSLTTGSKYYVQTDGSILASAQNAAYDIASASYSNKSFSVASQESNPKGIAFNTTGTRMYIVGSVNNTVYEYNLSTAFDVSTTVYSQSFSLVANVSSASDIVFNNDGTKMFVLDRSGSAVDQYALSSGFDVSTSSYTQSFSVSTQENQAEGLRFNTDGTRMFVVGENGDDVNEYALSTGFDVSTASFTDSFSVASQETDPKTLAFNADGTKMFVLGAINDSIFEYTLTTGFDVSTASYSSTSFSVNSQDPNASGMAFSEDGTKFYVMGSNDTVYQYATSLGAFSTTVNAGLAISTTSLLLNGDS